MNIVAVPAAFGSAVCFAVASALEQSAAKQEAPSQPLDLRLIARLAHRPRWLLGWIPEAAGTGLQALALNFGPLALVEPILISGLFLAIPLAAVLNRRPIHKRDFGVVVLGGAGLVAFLLAAQPKDGVAEPSLLSWLGVALWAVPALAVCLAVAWRIRGPARGALLGVATGLLFALGASLLKSVTAKLATDPLSVFTTWQLYALAVVGVCAIALNQNAFQSGRIAVPLTAITITDPFASVMIGVTAFHETISTGWLRGGVEVFAVLAMVTGIVLAGHSHSERRDRRTSDARAPSAQPRQPG